MSYSSVHQKLQDLLYQQLCRYQFDRLPSPPPGLTPGPLIFSAKIPTSGPAFQCKTPAPGVEKMKQKSPPSGITCLARMWMKKQFLSKFSIIVHLTIFFYHENKVFASLLQQFSSVHFISHILKKYKIYIQIRIYKNINILSINSIKEESLNSRASDKPPPPPPPCMNNFLSC